MTAGKRKGADLSPEAQRLRLNPERKRTERIMSKVAQKVFFANFYAEAGTLAKVDGELMFFSDAGDITTVEPADVNFLVVCGEVGTAEAAALADKRHGGRAWIATHRSQEAA
jgi:hypothetical protein